MYLYITEPKSNPIGFIVVFGSIILSSVAFIYCLFVKRGKKLKQREPRPWDRLYAVHTERDLDDYERHLGGDVAQIEEIQSN